MIYKTLKKVSDYCQLLDKSKYPATQTVNGVTFTKVDGGYQLNGTCTGSTNLYISSGILISKGHKYLLLDNRTQRISNNYSSTVQILNDSATFSFSTTDNMDEGVFFTNVVTKDDICNMRIRIDNGIVYNVVLLPQLFDLTEMYGAGNEPTTVEEFRTKFPNELYDYKPYCFVKSYKTLLKATDNKIITSYKKSLACKTKNLFDISKVPTISGSLIVKDNSICSYAYPAVTNDPNLLSIFKSLKPDTNYTMSATTLNYLDAATNYIVLIFSNALGDKIIFYNYSAGFNKVTFSLTQEQINNITNVYFYGRDESSGGPTMWSNIQLEEGSTATEYHPYGYL